MSLTATVHAAATIADALGRAEVSDCVVLSVSAPYGVTVTILSGTEPDDAATVRGAVFGVVDYPTWDGRRLTGRIDDVPVTLSQLLVVEGVGA